MPLTLRYVARSNVGLIREGNEDSGYAGPYLLAVADGMGGHAAGEVASRAAIEELVATENVPTDDPLEALSTAIDTANDRIRELISEDPSREGMGTTVTAMLWTGSTLGLGHIGDSRAYLLRGEHIFQLSHDHTFVQSLVDEGKITEEEADVHPARSLILKALQGQGVVEPDLTTIDIEPGDRVLVCSDGLSGVVSDDTLAETLHSIQGLDDVADELVRLALAGGAPDNVTLIVADVVETEEPRSPDETAEAYIVGAAAGDQPPGKERPHRGRTATALRALLGAEEKPPDPEDLEALRYAPRPPSKYRWVRRVALLIIIVVIGWGGLSLANNWVSSQYYVGQSDGEVAIYQGLSQELGPIRLSELHDIPGGLPVDALPALYREQVDGTIAADSIQDAEQIVMTLRRQACDSAAEDEQSDDTSTSSTRSPDESETESEPTSQPEQTRGTDRSPRPRATVEEQAEAEPDGWESTGADLDCTGTL
ncbi:serine/threonine-protein phosphatase [Actinobacteria bacterium YIM 96077]|uniref:Serine/threonine protein phosphatase PstP n=1 Tax=Phytoactinopolyspora halophila TaxID=1981511 RepID=A0A329QVC4_9ACTN|nr:PP2C family serine/threonine-protein phosphatase [Phytoactinopolyspora halophila]AYY11382.1 serine/threonine-protein phosphatase [Actinobacteria bacterium YIM 96077]RAW14668.1 protein phosphatase [Phytoactinopolyspora halophila]